MNTSTRLRLGTRGSKLAMWQAKWVAERLRQNGQDVQVVPVTTAGDRGPGAGEAVVTPGLFTQELQNHLLAGNLDLAVHSLKDLPTRGPAGLVVAAVPLRDSPYDVLVTENRHTLATLPPSSRIGTGSARRRAQILHARGDLHVVDIRGNVDTRLAKLDQGSYDGLILAEAGLVRLGCPERIAERLALDVCLPAPGQGAVAIETATENQAATRAAVAINDPRCQATTTAERSFLACIEAGCSSPAAALCQIKSDDSLLLEIAVFSMDGTQKIVAAAKGATHEAKQLGEQAAAKALASGAADLLRIPDAFLSHLWRMCGNQSPNNPGC